MQTSSYVNGVFDGDFAKAAWKGYLSNITGFGTDQLPKAQRIEAVQRVLLRAPDGFAKTQLMAAFTEKNVAAFAKTAVSAMLLGPAANNVRNILYVHTRTRQFGAGHATHLVRKAQAMSLNPSEPKSLSTTAAACNGWYASLLFLRNGFTCDMALFKTDITMPGEVTTGGSSALSFRYPPSAGEDQVELVKAAMKSQRARRSQRSRDFADELERVLDYVSKKTQEQFNAELANTTAFTDSIAVRTEPSVSSSSRKSRKRKMKEAESSEEKPSYAPSYAPPVCRSKSKEAVQTAVQTAVVTPRPTVPSNRASSSAKVANRASRSSRSSSRKKTEDSITREVEDTVDRLMQAYSDDDDDDGD